MRVRIAFQLSADERFLVLCEELPACGSQGEITLTTFESDGDFLQQIVFAELPHDTAVSLIAGVLITLSQAGAAPGALGKRWSTIALTPGQLLHLGLARPEQAEPGNSFLGDLREVMMQTPTPFVVLSGPEHRLTFVNQAYADLMQRPSPEAVMGKKIREALPELEGQRFVSLLDSVYRTGQPFVGRSVPGTLCNQRTGRIEERYFDFVYYPIRNFEDEVCGIMVHATDVTANRLEQQVGSSREKQLYKQWAELETIYRYSPMAMCLVDVKTFCILRLNDLAAEQFGADQESILNRVIFDLLPDVPVLRELYSRVERGEVVRNYELSLELPRYSGVIRTWLLTMSPLFDERGTVELIESVAVEISDRVRHESTENLLESSLVEQR